MPANPLYLRAGELRHQIQIQAPSSTRDASGQVVSTWTALLTTRAAMLNTTGQSYKEAYAENALVSQSTWVIKIRWPGTGCTVEPGQRVQYGSDLYLIQAVDNVLQRNRVLNLYCMAVDADSNS